MLARGYLGLRTRASLRPIRLLSYIAPSVSPAKVGAEALGPHDQRVVGPFLLVHEVVQTGREQG